MSNLFCLAGESANFCFWDIQICLYPINPLVEKLLTMDKYQRGQVTPSDNFHTDHRLATTRRGDNDSLIVQQCFPHRRFLRQCQVDQAIE